MRNPWGSQIYENDDYSTAVAGGGVCRIRREYLDNEFESWVTLE